MKKLGLLIITGLLVATAYTQTVRKWNAIAGGAWSNPANWLPAGVPANGDILVFDSGISATITQVAQAGDITLGGITISGNSSIQLQHTASRTISVNNSASEYDLLIEPGSQLVLATGITVQLDAAAESIIKGIFKINTGAEFQCAGNTTVTGILESSGSITAPAGTHFFMQDSSRYIHAKNGGAIPAAQWSQGATCEVTGITNTAPSGLGQNFGNFTWNCAAQDNYATNLPATMYIAGDFVMQAGRLQVNGTSASAVIDVKGDVLIKGGELRSTGNSGENILTLQLAGDFTMEGGKILTSAGSTVKAIARIIFSGSTEQKFNKTGGTVTETKSGSGTALNSFIIKSGAIVNFGTNVLNGDADFNLEAGANIITAHPSGLYSAGNTGTIQVTGQRIFSEKAGYEFRGSNTGIFNTGSSSASQPSELAMLVVNNTNGSVTLSKPLSVTNGGKLYLQNGVLYTSSSMLLELADDAIATGDAGGQANVFNKNSYIHGPVRKSGNDAFTFPVGRNGTGMVPVAIVDDNAGPSNTYTIEYLRETAPDNTRITANTISKINSCDFWKINHSAGSSTDIDFIFYWNDNTGCNGANMISAASEVRAVRHDGVGNWSSSSYTYGNGSIEAGKAVWDDLALQTGSNQHIFTLGIASIVNNPLPVMFSGVRSWLKEQEGVQVEWSNMTERDISHYAIERSANGFDFIMAGEVLPKNNLDQQASYSFLDKTIFEGPNFYRIKVYEKHGKVIYSKVMRVENNPERAKSFQLYPNPVAGQHLMLALTGIRKGSYQVKIFNNMGTAVFQTRIQHKSSSGVQEIILPAGMRTGTYMVELADADYRAVSQLLVR